jgi:sugar phosphate isomerase/epimerase
MPVFVACSTSCFNKYPLEHALRVIAELEFNKIDVAIHERSPHLKPSEVAADVSAAAHELRLGTGVAPVAFSVEIDAPDDREYRRLLRALCRLARLTAVPVLTVPAAPSGTGVDAEVRRLTSLATEAGGEGVQLALDTRVGTLTEDPDTAVELCERVPGLGLTFDPSHYLAGPHQGKSFEHVYPYVRHVHLRDTGRGPNQFQVRVGQGEVEYGRIVSQLSRHEYERALTVDIRDSGEAPFPMEPEVRKLKYLLESLV